MKERSGQPPHASPTHLTPLHSTPTDFSSEHRYYHITYFLPIFVYCLYIPLEYKLLQARDLPFSFLLPHHRLTHSLAHSQLSGNSCYENDIAMPPHFHPILVKWPRCFLLQCLLLSCRTGLNTWPLNLKCRFRSCR